MNARPAKEPEAYDAETARLIRGVLEEVARKIEGLSGNTSYEAAWAKAAKIIRDSKPD